MGGRLLGDDGFATGIKPLYAACPQDLSVLAWPKDIRLAKITKASAIIISSDWAADYADEIAASLIVIDDLPRAFACLFELLSRGMFGPPPIAEARVHSRALIASSAHIGAAQIGASSIIGHHVVIEDDVMIGSHCLIGPHVVVHRGSRIGDHCVLGAHTTIASGAFAPYGDLKPQILSSLGNVKIGNHVSIGASCTIDRGLLGTTSIGDYCKLDSQVHIGHDAQLEREVMMAAQSGLAGFVRIGTKVTIGGQAGVGPHVQIGCSARVSAKTFVHKNLKSFAICSGNPGLPHELYLKAYKQKLINKSGISHERV